MTERENERAKDTENKKRESDGGGKVVVNETQQGEGKCTQMRGEREQGTEWRKAECEFSDFAVLLQKREELAPPKNNWRAHHSSGIPTLFR